MYATILNWGNNESLDSCLCITFCFCYQNNCSIQCIVSHNICNNFLLSYYCTNFVAYLQCLNQMPQLWFFLSMLLCEYFSRAAFTILESPQISTSWVVILCMVLPAIRLCLAVQNHDVILISWPHCNNWWRRAGVHTILLVHFLMVWTNERLTLLLVQWSLFVHHGILAFTIGVSTVYGWFWFSSDCVATIQRQRYLIVVSDWIWSDYHFLHEHFWIGVGSGSGHDQTIFLADLSDLTLFLLNFFFVDWQIC